MSPHMHRPVTCVLALLLAVGALLFGASPATAGEGNTIKRLANAARAEAGLDPLTRDSDLDRLARKWAYKIAADGALSHNPDLAEQVPEGWQGVGENVAMGYPTGAEMHQGWMDSEGHRANILGDYTHIGIAFVVVDGTSWGVQVFGKYPPGVRPTAKPKAATSAPAPAPAPAVPASTKPASPRTAAPEEAEKSAKPSPTSTTSASASPSTSALAGSDSETAGPVMFSDASGSPTASGGPAGIGYVELAIGVLGLSGLGLLIAFLLARRRRRERRRRDLEAYPARPLRPAVAHPVGAPVYRGQVFPVRPGPAQPAQPHPYPGNHRRW